MAVVASRMFPTARFTGITTQSSLARLPTFSGGAPTRVWVGTDGGVHSSTDGGGTWANLNETIATNLFRHIDIGRGSTTNRGYTYGGTQDTGVIEHNPTIHPGNDWHLARDGDGGIMAVDPLNPAHAFCTDNSRYVQTTDGGASWPLDGHGFTSAGGISNVLYDPNGTNAYLAYQGTQLWRSTDNTGNFAIIHTFPAAIQAMSMTKIDSNTMWVGLANGTVQRTSNLLAGVNSTWTARTVAGAPAGQGVASPQGIVVDPSNTNEAVVAYPGFTGINPANRTQHVFRTTNNGVTWTDISGTDAINGGDPAQNLPDLPLHAVVIDSGTSPHSIIVASDAGVTRTADLGATWQILGTGLPIVDCTALAIDASAIPALLRVGTYGRSTFELAFDRLYVDLRNTIGPNDGTQEHPFLRVIDALNVPASGRQKVINIQAGNYPESLLPVTQAVIFNSMNGEATIR